MPTKRPSRAPCNPGRQPSLHERLIRGLIDSDPRMARNGFWRQHKALVDKLGLDQDEFPSGRFLPDAFLFDEGAQEILLFEVEVSCALTPLKADDYGWLWHCWECEDSTDWLPRLFIVDRYGHRNELSLAELSYA